MVGGGRSRTNSHSRTFREKAARKLDPQGWVTALSDVGILGTGLGMADEILVQSERLVFVQNHTNEISLDYHYESMRLDEGVDQLRKECHTEFLEGNETVRSERSFDATHNHSRRETSPLVED